MELSFLVGSETAAAGRRPGPSSVAWCFGVAKPTFWRLEGAINSFQFRSDVGQRQPQAEGQVRPSVAWCFGVAKPTFWRLEGSNLELATCWFRKRR